MASLHCYDEVDSTNERALQALAQGSAQHLEAHFALSQSAGRGRLGRSWASPRGAGVYLSLVLRPEAACPAPALTMSAGLGCLGAVRALGVEAVTLDWPNDLELGGAKLAGVLVESRGLPDCVVGVGLNLRPELLPAELRAQRPVAGLLEYAPGLTLERMREALIEHLRMELGRALETPSEVPARYLDALGLRGQRVLVTSAGGELSGRLLGIELERGLSLQGEDNIESWAALEHVQALRRL